MTDNIKIMRLEIIKEIDLKIHGGLKKVSDIIEAAPEDQSEILIRMGFAKESTESKNINSDDDELDKLIQAEEVEKSTKQKRTRRTKVQIEADKNK